LTSPFPFFFVASGDDSFGAKYAIDIAGERTEFSSFSSLFMGYIKLSRMDFHLFVQEYLLAKILYLSAGEYNLL
jgi:hypothetical protein